VDAPEDVARVEQLLKQERKRPGKPPAKPKGGFPDG